MLTAHALRSRGRLRDLEHQWHDEPEHAGKMVNLGLDQSRRGERRAYVGDRWVTESEELEA